MKLLKTLHMHGGAIAMACLGFIGASSTQSHAESWNLNNSGSWDSAANWDDGTGSFPNGVNAIADFASLDINNTRTVSLNQSITLGTLLLGDSSGSNAYIFAVGTAGAFVFNSGTGTSNITKTSGGTDYIKCGITLMEDMDIDISTGTLYFQDAVAIISGSYGITKTGAGTLALGGGGVAPTHTFGSLTINEGTVLHQGGSITNIGNITINGSAGKALLQGYYLTGFTRALGSGSNQFQITGGISGFRNNQSQTVRIGGNANNEAVWGSTYFNPDTFVLDNGWSGSGVKDLTFDNKLDLNGATRNISVSQAGGATANSSIINGIIRDSQSSGAGINKYGDGYLKLTKANTFSGGINIIEGGIRVSNAAATGTGALTFSGGGTSLDLNSNLTIYGISSTATYYGTITNTAAGAYTLTIDQDADSTYRGVINNGSGGGSVAITKIGTGALTLEDAASYHSGATNVNEGRLMVNTDWSASTSLVTVASGAAFGGSGTLGGSVILSDGAILAFDPTTTLTVDGASVDLGNLSLANLLMVNAGSISNGTYTLIDGAATIDVSSVQNFGSGNSDIYEGKTAYFQSGSSSEFQLVVIPEPSVFALILITAIGLTFRRKR